MKRISILIAALALNLAAPAHSQDAATEERLNQLNGRVDDLIATQKVLRERLTELAKEIEGLREQQSKPNNAYASQEDVKRLVEKLQEVDKNRERDKELILKEIAKLGKSVAPAPSGGSTKKAPHPTPPEDPTGNQSKPPGNDKAFEYTIQSGDTLSTISQAFKEQKNIKVSVDQILAANPGLKPEKMQVGKKILIPVPQP
jgi:TolA-binding protein